MRKIRGVPSNEGIPSTLIQKMFNISQRRLSYWIQTGLVKPKILGGKGGRLPSGEYSTHIFDRAGLMEIKTIFHLLDQGMSIYRIRKIIDYLRSNGYSLDEVEYLTDGNFFFMRDLEYDNRVIELGKPNQFVLLDWKEISEWVNRTYDNRIGNRYE